MYTKMEYNLVIQIFIIGLAIMVGAVIINYIAILLGLQTWYTFLPNLIKSGFKGQTMSNLLFLFIIYPLLLGAIGYYTTRSFF